MKKRIVAALAAVITALPLINGCSLFGGSQQVTNAIGSYDFTHMELVQLNNPAEGQDVAIIETNMGTMTAVLYAEYAPNTVANFKKRVEEGFYDNKPFFALQEGVYAITGAANEEGTEGRTDDGQFIENECTVNLWPFKGALLGYSGQMGYCDSRFFFTGAIEITEENKKELSGYVDEETSSQIIPNELINAFEKRGSVPGLAGAYTVFGQLINGYDTLDKILWSGMDEKTQKPTSELIIKKITLDTYSEGKFTIEEPTADKYLSAEDIEKLESSN